LFGNLEFFQGWSEIGSICIRLLAAVVLGGLVGYEREHVNRPAGFRTHILVCLGSALVMVTAEFLTQRYADGVNLDPTRLGAQVISGIGFLGAGTIIRNGNSVKGLTTAASLWAVSCIGLACGGGFLVGAFLVTVLTYVTLISLKRFEWKIGRRSAQTCILVKMTHIGEDIMGIILKAEMLHMGLRKYEIASCKDGGDGIQIRFLISHVDEKDKTAFVMAIKEIGSVKSVLVEPWSEPYPNSTDLG
jgi:putative Mg2+ transporter-C (MgtC) family protein